ncbi:hypothetical protein NBRC116585_04370 [Thalassolituus maritimus]|uniref:Uncharacterized protein n=1 Tax=Thalassolituus maritimus TaxID=484498 RepID=A0ABP9ZW09_9GAMM
MNIMRKKLPTNRPINYESQETIFIVGTADDQRSSGNAGIGGRSADRTGKVRRHGGRL